jgi:hypothetical protein
MAKWNIPPEKRRHCYLLAILAAVSMVFLQNQCNEPYYPELDVPGSILVVEGLLTDIPGPHYVRLSKAAGFSGESVQVPLTGAAVSLVDNEGETELFREVMPGIYHSSSDFAGRKYREYTLGIITADGKKYHSSPQLLIPVYHTIDNMTGVYLQDKEIEVPTNAGTVQLEKIEAIEVFCEVRNLPEEFPKMRFEVDILLQYRMMKEQRTPTTDPPVYHCRIRNKMGTVPNITKAGEQTATRNAVYHNLGFIPESKKYYYNLLYFGDIDRRILLVNQYSLNDYSYNYYRALEKLLSAEGRLFDPVAQRLEGNIFSADDITETVLGFFEVSGKSRASFVLGPGTFPKTGVEFQLTHCLHHVPEYECFYEIHPPLWIHR